MKWKLQYYKSDENIFPLRLCTFIIACACTAIVYQIKWYPLTERYTKKEKQFWNEQKHKILKKLNN